jgi:hypothetical protein
MQVNLTALRQKSVKYLWTKSGDIYVGVLQLSKGNCCETKTEENRKRWHNVTD